MTIPEEDFCCGSSSARVITTGHHPLYEAIVLKAREQGYCASRRVNIASLYGEDSSLAGGSSDGDRDSG